MSAQDISIIIGAVAGLITVIGGVVLQVLTFLRQGDLKKSTDALHATVTAQMSQGKDQP